MATARLDHVGGKGEGAAEDAARDPDDRSDSRHGRSGRYRATCRRVAGASAFLLLRRCGPSGVGRHCDLIDRRAELPHAISSQILRPCRGRLRFARARFVDHPLEQASHRDAEARRLCLDPGAPLVIEPDAYNGGLCRRHDPLTVTRGVYVGGRRMVATRWWLVQARRRRGWEPLLRPGGPGLRRIHRSLGHSGSTTTEAVVMRSSAGAKGEVRQRRPREDCGDAATAPAVGNESGCRRRGVWARSLERPRAPLSRGAVLTVLHRMFTSKGGRATA